MDSGSLGAVALWGAVGATGVATGTGVLAWTIGGSAGSARRAAGSGGGRAPGATRRALATARRASLAAVGLASAALLALVWSLLTGNYALAYVADTTTRQGAWYYRLAGLWGGNGGSLLLWGWFILLAGVWATRRSPPARLIATAAGGAVLLVAAVAANPFQRLQIPAIDGGGLNPILQYPAMLYHPLVLYAGHAGLVAAFALAVAGLLAAPSRRSPAADAAWWAAIRRTTLVAWLLLGVGLVAGARWAYVELGWGGFWGWDPVENSGLLPWLAATAFLHAARRARLDGERLPSVGLVALAGVPFCFSLLGATLSRSGAAQSVHAFADAKAVGWGLAIIFAAAATTLAWVAVRAARRPVPEPAPAAARHLVEVPVAVSGELAAARHPVEVPVAVGDGGAAARPQSVALAAGTVVLLAVATVVAFGTVFPVLSRLIGGGTEEVTVAYYAKVVTPLAVIGAVVMGVAPSLRRRMAVTARHGKRQRTSPGGGSVGLAGGWGLVARTRAAVLGRWRWWLAAGAAAAVATAMAGHDAAASMALGAAAAAALVLTVAALVAGGGLRRAGALLAHLGVALLLLGVAGSLLGHETTAVVPVGGSVMIGGYRLHYRDIALDQGDGWQRARVVLDVNHGGHHVGTLEPGLKVFTDGTAALSQVAIGSRPDQDLIVAAQSIDPSTSAADLDVTDRPLVEAVWWGAAITALGGILVLVAGRRDRVRTAPGQTGSGFAAPRAPYRTPSGPAEAKRVRGMVAFNRVRLSDDTS